MRRTSGSVPFLCAVLVALLSGATADAAAHFNVTFSDPDRAWGEYYEPIRRNLLAAADEWGRHLTGDATIDLEVAFTSEATMSSTSVTVVFVRNNGTYDVFEQGAAAKLRGTDSNGRAPDAHVGIGTEYLRRDLWFDPDPQSRTAPVPPDRVDAYSVFLHEIGHVLVFNGWRNSLTGELPAHFESTYDSNILFDGENFYFTGPRAQSVYGGPVPLSFGLCTHVGNNAPRPGAELCSRRVLEVMNGQTQFRGTRYHLSPLDLAIVADCGVAVRTEPETPPAPVVARANARPVHSARVQAAAQPVVSSDVPGELAAGVTLQGLAAATLIAVVTIALLVAAAGAVVWLRLNA